MPQAQEAIMATVLLNTVMFLQKDEMSEFFSVYNQRLKSMLVSMFSHADAPHLLFNMASLLTNSHQVFVATSSDTWKNALSFLAVYLGSGLGGYGSVSALSFLHQRQWDQTIHRTRSGWSQATGFDWTWPVADAWTYLSNLETATNRFWFNAIPRIGASGAVMGVLGARVYTSLLQQPSRQAGGDYYHAVPPWHGRMTGLEMARIASLLAVEFARVPLKLDSIPLQDNVDHVAHVGGFLSGVCIAAIIQRIARRREGRGNSYY